ncbi:hypothetical protein [Salinibacter altiplanensis]|uniref:hypothetical protein n=1 Tax=Salinibacter altiplanensis TaxID=1803181 RepID=UPI000C9F6E8B|nr:hypothetical protein [Salinibacter altiplanensis]
MTQLEYLIALISIIVGLGLTDLAQSFRELLRPGYSVRWDGLPLAWSMFVFVLTILLWWNGFGVLKGREETGPFFLMYLLLFFLLYLCCAFALPDPDWEGRSGSSSLAGSSKHSIDLKAFYFSMQHRRCFFGLLVGFILMLTAINQFAFEWDGARDRLESALTTMGVAVLLAIPIGTDRHWAHWIAVTVVITLLGFFAVKEIVF